MRSLIVRERHQFAFDGVLWRIGMCFGKAHRIELSLHWLFACTLVLITCLLAQALFPRLFPGWPTSSYWLVALAVAVTDSLAALLHELGHAGVAVGRGRRVYRITLYGLAAAARRSRGPTRMQDQVAIAVAGPLSQLLVASLLLAVWNTLPADNLPLRVATGFPAFSNFAVGLFNLVPVAPLDGGRVARALIAGIFRV